MTLAFIVKCTRRCNLRCSYCHDWRDRGVSALSLENLAKLNKKAFSHDNNVSFIWHGGEPLLLGKEWFKKALLIQDLAMDEHQNVRNLLQTNATLLDEEWAEFFKEHNFHIGVSVDGPPSLHDKTRIDVQGRGTSDRVLKGVESLKEYDVPFGMLMVVTEQVAKQDPKEIYKWFKSMNTPSVGFLPQRPDTEGLEKVREPSESSTFLRNEMYSDFMCDIFDCWWEDDGDGPEVRELFSLLSGIVGSDPGLCIYAGSCVGNYFGIDPNGDVYHCDKYMPDPKYKIGNISEDEFSFMSEKLLNLQEKEQEAEAQAAESCKWYSVCHGGCPHDRNTDPLGWKERGSCCGMNSLLTHIETNVKEAVPPEL